MAILITGATGCVGTYLADALLAQTAEDLVLVVRDPNRLTARVRASSRVRVVRADLRDTDRIATALDGVTTAILVATSWGGPDAAAITCTANLALTDRLIEAGCERVIYFATASVLAPDGSILNVAGQEGTEYIRAKHQLVEAMETRADLVQICGVFPTLVLGGTPDGPAPLSHFARLLRQLMRWMWLIRFFSAEARLHIIHAADIATVTRYLCSVQDPPLRIVLGNPARSADDLVAEVCAHLGKRRRALLTLRPEKVEPLIRLFRIQLSPWDRYCMMHPDQAYPGAVCPADLGLPQHMPSLSEGLRSLGIARRG